ncbi:MAG: DUF2282 domain-containing protein [Rhodospirillaceae bacterium]|nr:DUF2282 domain-containing protein [Rhodospirillaceae bacterium]
MKSFAITRSAVAALVAGAALTIATTQAAEKATGKPDREHCYGIAKAGENNCAAANGKHSCAGQAKVNYSGQEFKEVVKGTCDQMMGSTTPFEGVNTKIKG